VRLHHRLLFYSLDGERMQWRLPFGAVAVVVGAFVLVAAWAEPPVLYASTACAVPEAPGVHLGTDWTVEYYNSCGGEYEYALGYFVAFTAVGLTLVGGGAATIREVLS